MRVFKFGGASVKDALGVKNLAKIVNENLDQALVVVVSAMGKSTNLFEKICDLGHREKRVDKENIETSRSYHLAICQELFVTEHPVFDKVNALFHQMERSIKEHLDEEFDCYYDQIVSYGEALSTLIVSEYLNSKNVESQLVFAGDIIKTNSNYRDARVDWKESQKAAARYAPEAGMLVLTQGFLGADPKGMTTTLGREGSDYSAAILAYLFNANQVVIWKDVPGMLNADPRRFSNTQKLDEISFKEAIELSYFGATVIHPKTLQPLREKNLPLYVRSFLNSTDSGSMIFSNEAFDHLIPSYILKDDQVLISIIPSDLTFVVEENLSEIFAVFSRFKVKIHLMQNSALSFSVCVDNDNRKVPALIDELSKNFKIKFNSGLQLLTVRHYSEDLIEELIKDKEILLEQKTRHTARFVYR